MQFQKTIATPKQSCTVEFGLRYGLFVWLVADAWCWFVLREKYWWLICSERKVLLVGADKRNEHAGT
jgi:hypothetical protein